MKIAWFSKHQPLGAQRKALRDMFGPHELIVDGDMFGNAADIISRYKRMNADEMVLVAPFTVIKLICEQDIYPLWADMENISPPQKPDWYRMVKVNGRWQKFNRFIRAVGVDFNFVDVNQTCPPFINIMRKQFNDRPH